jgi:hypothetical protein
MNEWLSTHNLYCTENLQNSLQDIQDIHLAQHRHSGTQLPNYMIQQDRISECNEIRRQKGEYLVAQLTIKMSEGDAGVHNNIGDDDLLQLSWE